MIRAHFLNVLRDQLEFYTTKLSQIGFICFDATVEIVGQTFRANISWIFLSKILNIYIYIYLRIVSAIRR